MKIKEAVTLTPCRYCGGRAHVVKGTFSCWVTCPACGITTRQFNSAAEAEKYWNRETETDEV